MSLVDISNDMDELKDQIHELASIINTVMSDETFKEPVCYYTMLALKRMAYSAHEEADRLFDRFEDFRRGVPAPQLIAAKVVRKRKVRR
jgi:hypothetical protein